MAGLPAGAPFRFNACTGKGIFSRSGFLLMTVQSGQALMPDGQWAVVQRLERDDLVGLGLALPALWLLLSAADWQAVFGALR